MSNDRRRFFRIEDRIFLQIRLIDQAELEAALEDFWNNRHQFMLRNDFNQRLDEHQADFYLIQNKTPELARYLKVMQEQIDRLTETVLPEQVPTRDQEANVSLSAQGISFITDENLNPADVVELRLKLQPSRQELVVIARVVLVEDMDNDDDGYESGQHRVSLDFENIHEADREILVKHVHNRQLSTLGIERDVGA